MNEKAKWFLVGLCVAVTTMYVIWFYQMNKVVASDHAVLSQIVSAIKASQSAPAK